MVLVHAPQLPGMGCLGEESSFFQAKLVIGRRNQAMRNASKALGIQIKNRWSWAPQALSYQNIAGGLASEMVGFLRSTETCKSSPPFRLVIIGNQGGVVFECEVGQDWEVQNPGPAGRVRRSHFPATALLTDGSLLTRTFLIERAPLADSSN
jgi:hypothetical protein